MLNKRDFTIDHIIPRSQGGRDTWSNTACACAKCNHRKGNRLHNVAGMRLLWEPKTPRTSYLVIALRIRSRSLETVRRNLVRLLPRDSSLRTLILT